jgi:hypothetical protein
VSFQIYIFLKFFFLNIIFSNRFSMSFPPICLKQQKNRKTNMSSLVKITSFKHFSYKLQNHKMKLRWIWVRKPKSLALIIVPEIYFLPWPSASFLHSTILHDLHHTTKANLENSNPPPTSDLGVNIPWKTTQQIP